MLLSVFEVGLFYSAELKITDIDAVDRNKLLNRLDEINNNKMVSYLDNTNNEKCMNKKIKV